MDAKIMEDNIDSYDRLRRRILWSIVNGLYLVGSAHGDERNVMTCSFVTQVATEPKLVGIGVEREALSARLITDSKAFSVMFLSREQKDIVRKFVKPAFCDHDKNELNGYAYLDGPSTKAPILENILAYLECTLYQKLDFESHTFFIGEVVNASFANMDLIDSERTEQNQELPVLRMEDTRMHYGG